MQLELIGRAVLIRGFLPQPDRDAIFNYVIANVDRFIPSTVTSGVEDFRRSIVLYDFQPWQGFMIDRVKTALPAICDALDIEQFEPTDIECQLTCSSSGDYFNRHTDDGADATATRKVSWVFYLKNSPDSFTGGDLRFFGADSDEALEVAIPPVDNACVMFKSNQWHSVDPVHQNSNDIRLSRMTCNGWVRG